MEGVTSCSAERVQDGATDEDLQLSVLPPSICYTKTPKLEYASELGTADAVAQLHVGSTSVSYSG
jgi:hypothetical protein